MLALAITGCLCLHVIPSFPSPALAEDETSGGLSAPEPANAEPSIRIAPSRKTSASLPLLADAWQAYRSGNLDGAARYYEKILEGDSRNRDALLGMAAVSQRRGHKAVAARCYARILAQDPFDPYAHAGLISIRTLAGTADGRELLQRLIEQHPDAAVLHLALGNLYAGQSRWSDARRAYSYACNLEACDAGTAFNLAVSLDHLGQTEAATRYYRQALQMDNAGDAGFDHAQTQLRLKQLPTSGENTWTR